MMRQRSSEDSSFPYWVALVSLLFALVLFFSNTVPALREQQSLQALADELSDLRRRYEDAIRQAALATGSRHDYDLQSLLVAIDQLGYTPHELCQTHPLPSAHDDSSSSGSSSSGSSSSGSVSTGSPFAADDRDPR